MPYPKTPVADLKGHGLIMRDAGFKARNQRFERARLPAVPQRLQNGSALAAEGA
jgi:hypothetical protein